MASVNSLSPWQLFGKLADVFQKNPLVATNSVNTEQKVVALPRPASRLNISLQDLKIISTALLHYRRSLARMGEQDRAQGVAEIDRRFYEIINQLEAQVQAQPSAAA
ncbi:MAG: hypothetical protein OHK0053_26020 [Microscillaceae bacterium]